MRLDRLLTLGVIGPLRSALSSIRATQSADNYLPILMYHSVSEDAETHLPPYYRVCISPARFAQHMAWLAEWGFRGVTLTQGLAELAAAGQSSGKLSSLTTGTTDILAAPTSHSTSQPAKLVAITFDDGFLNFLTGAFPSLHQHGFSATMYLPTAFIANQSRRLASRDCLTWPQVKELHQHGIEFGSHSVSHSRLTKLSWPQIESELRNSKHAIEQQLSAAVVSFAYPYAYPSANADFSLRFRQLLSATGYATSVTTTIGRATANRSPLELPRLPANSADDDQLLAAKLLGKYDWMERVQTVSKTFRRCLRAKHRESENLLS